MKILFEQELIINEAAAEVIVKHHRRARKAAVSTYFPQLGDLHINGVADREGVVLRIVARAKL